MNPNNFMGSRVMLKTVYIPEEVTLKALNSFNFHIIIVYEQFTSSVLSRAYCLKNADNMKIHYKTMEINTPKIGQGLF